MASRGSSIVLLNEKNEMLLLKRSPRMVWMPGKWGLPGGIIEKGELFEGAAVRETLEETCLAVNEEDLTLLSLNEKVVVFLSRQYEGTILLDHEHTDWTWVKREDITTYDTVPRLAELFDRALNYDDGK